MLIRRSWSHSVLVAVLSAAPLRAADAPPPTFTSGVELVTIDAVVIAEKGRPVRGLTKDDFIVEEDGKPREMPSSEPFELETSEPSDTPVVHPVLASNEVKPKTTGRAYALVFDDLALSPADMKVARAAINRFVQNGLRDGDE